MSRDSKVIKIRLPVKMLAHLDGLCERCGLPNGRAEIIRVALADFLYRTNKLASGK